MFYHEWNSDRFQVWEAPFLNVFLLHIEQWDKHFQKHHCKPSYILFNSNGLFSHSYVSTKCNIQPLESFHVMHQLTLNPLILLHLRYNFISFVNRKSRKPINSLASVFMFIPFFKSFISFSFKKCIENWSMLKTLLH